MQNQSAIFTRRSIRKYDPAKPATKEQIEDVLNAAMHAPTAMGKAPWEFFVAQTRETLQKIMRAHPYCESLSDAGTAIVVCANLDEEFKCEDGSYHAYDCSAATQNILLRAKELGLGTCWCGIEPEKARMAAVSEALGLPANIAPMALVILGTPAEDPKLEKPRWNAKKVHWEKW